jgi:WD40 repeat protein/serine/threonine protein kinase
MADRDLCGRTLGEYVLLELIGEGGFGAIYRCVQPSLKRDVVVKVLHERRRSSNVALERFLREAELASRLDHPYAVHLYDFGIEDGLVWLAMELVQGITLDEWLRERGPMPLEQFVPFFECVAQVVQAAHERGIVHRDLKPSNVMVTARGGRLFPKLLDFGIAKVSHEAARPTPEIWPDGSLAENQEPVDAQGADGMVTARMRAAPPRVQRTRTDPSSNVHRLTRSGAGIGSAAYMSPEQWENASAVGPASDIYSLGALAYKALTGRVPFTAESEREYYRHHLNTKVPPLGGDFSPDLDRVLQRALAKTPEARHGTALELASELRASTPELLRSAAQQWDDKGRASGLLWGADVLADVDRWRRRAPSGELSELECSFIADSQRKARHIRRVWRSLVALAAVSVFGMFQYRAAMQSRLAHEQTRMAQRVTEATITQAELEQGRSALLHNEREAQLHLTEAYRRDRSPSTAFMLARALQPRLAEQARFASSFGRMWSAVFSPDGKRLVTTDDRAAQVWDAQTYRLLFTLRHGDTVYQAVYNNDGTRLVTAGGDGTVRIWDAAGGTLVRELRRGNAKPRYYVVALSPDRKLVAAMDLGVAHVWDAGTGTPLAELRDDAASNLPSLAFSSDGHWLAMSTGNDVRVFDTRMWAQVRTIPGPAIHGLSWDPSGSRLLTGSAEGEVSIWAIPSGERIHHLREIGEPVDAVAFSPDGQLVVAASRDGAQQIWDATSGKLRSQGNYLHGKILSVEFDRTSTLVAAAGASGSVAVADAELGMPVTVLDGPRNVVRVAHFDPRSRRVVGASWDGTARIWDATAPYRRWNSPPISDDCGLVTSLEPDRRFLAVGCIDHPTRIWDTAHAELLAELPSVTQVHGDFASAYPAVPAAGDRAAIARGDTVEVYELPGGQLRRTIAHGAPVNTVAFASTGRDIVSGAVDGSLLVTRDNGALLALPASSAGIDAAGFLPDGRVVAADAQRRLRVYDRGGAVLTDLETSARVRTLRMSLDSRRLITVSSFTGKVAPPELWDLEHYRPIAPLAPLVGQGQVYSARFVAGGQVVTACGDGAVRLWDGATGQLRQTYHGGSRFLADVTLSPDGSLAVAGGADGVLRFWDAVSGRPLWTMPAHRSHLVGVRIEGDDIVTRGFSGDISRWKLPKSEQVIEACDGRDRCAIVSR